MAYVQTNILLTAPYTIPSDELFKLASSFQESLKTYYRMEDACRHPEYLEELLALLTSYYEGAGHGGSQRSDSKESPGTILHSPEAPAAGGSPAGGPRRRAGPRWRGLPARRSPRQRRPHPRPGAKEESAGAAVAICTGK